MSNHTPNLPVTTGTTSPSQWPRSQPISGGSSALNTPPEIWLKIFLDATWISGAFFLSDPHDTNAFVFDKYGKALHHRFRSAMSVNLSVSLVCKSWNSLIRNMLFRYILIRTGDQALRIADILENHESSSDIVRGPGWWTRRLEVALEHMTVWTHAHSDAFSRIIHSCPNLVVLSTAFCTENSHLFFLPVIHALPKCHSYSTQALRRLELRGDGALLKIPITSLAPFLEILCVRPSRGAGLSQESWACHLPRLHTLISTFGYGSNLTVGWDMPSLRTLFLYDNLDIKRWMERIGHRLQHLWLPHFFFLADTLSFCPNLHEIVIDFHDLIQQPLDSLMIHASLHCLVIRSPVLSTPLHPIHATDFVDRLRSNLNSLSSLHRFPSFKFVRLQLPPRAPTSVKSLLLLMWRTWLNSCEDLGLAVQYRRGGEEWEIDPEWEPFTIQFVENHLYY